MKTTGLIAALAALFAPHTAHALCIYKGEDNAKTTIDREFKDSRWVVKAKVLAAEDHTSAAGELWTMYRIEVQHAFKGHPATPLRFFTYRNSGGFYMDRAWVPLPAGHDLGGEYLLFLNPVRVYAGFPSAARGAVFVNYSCGVSGPWAGVPESGRIQLAALERARNGSSRS